MCINKNLFLCGKSLKIKQILRITHKIHMKYHTYPQFIHILWINLCKAKIIKNYVDNSKKIFYIIFILDFA